MDRILKHKDKRLKIISIFPPVWNSSFLFHTKQIMWLGRLTLISTFTQNAPFVKPIWKEWEIQLINSLTLRNQVSVLQIHTAVSYNMMLSLVFNNSKKNKIYNIANISPKSNPEIHILDYKLEQRTLHFVYLVANVNGIQCWLLKVGSHHTLNQGNEKNIMRLTVELD